MKFLIEVEVIPIRTTNLMVDATEIPVVIAGDVGRMLLDQKNRVQTLGWYVTEVSLGKVTDA